MSGLYSRSSIGLKSCSVCAATMNLSMKNTVTEAGVKKEKEQWMCGQCGYKEENEKVIYEKRPLFS